MSYISNRLLTVNNEVDPEKRDSKIRRLNRSTKRMGDENFISEALELNFASSQQAVKQALRAYYLPRGEQDSVVFRNWIPGSPEQASQQARHFVKSYKRFDQRSKDLLPYLKAVKRASDNFQLSHDDVIEILSSQFTEDILYSFTNSLKMYGLNETISSLLLRFGHTTSAAESKRLFTAYKVMLRNADESCFALRDLALSAYPKRGAAEIEAMVVSKIMNSLPSDVVDEILEVEDKVESLNDEDQSFTPLKFNEFVAKLRKILAHERTKKLFINHLTDE